MRGLVAVCLLLINSALAQTGNQNNFHGGGVVPVIASAPPVSLAGCGAFTDNTGCGPRTTDTYPATGTALPASSVCATVDAALVSGTPAVPRVYYLVQDVGDSASRTVNCLGFHSDVTVNLRGFTHYGNLCRNGSTGGFTLENGTVWGSRASTVNPCSGQGGVITITNMATCKTMANNFWDLTVKNDSTDDGSQQIHIDMAMGLDCPTAPQFWIDHMASTSPSLSAGSRTTNIYGGGSGVRTFQQIKVTNSALTFQATSNAQQGIIFYGCAYCLADHNYINGVCLNAGVSEAGRGLMADGQAVHATFTNNDVNVCNHRGLRVRDSVDVVATGNSFRGVTTSNGFNGKAFHLADPDSGDYDLGALSLSGNSVELASGGWGGWLRAGYMTGGLITGTTFTCASTGCANASAWILAQPSGSGSRSEWTVKADTYTGITPLVKAQYGRVADSSPVFRYNGIIVPLPDTSVGSITAPTITDVGP